MGDHEAPGYVPTFSARARTRVYVVCLVVPVLTTLVLTLLALLRVVDTVTAVAVIGAVGTAAGTLAGGFGVAYRPTRPVIGANGAQR